jgi:hypothetical protein
MSGEVKRLNTRYPYMDLTNLVKVLIYVYKMSQVKGISLALRVIEDCQNCNILNNSVLIQHFIS